MWSSQLRGVSTFVFARKMANPRLLLILLYTDLGVTGSGSVAGPLRATVQRGPIYPTPSGSPSVDGMHDPLLPAVEVSIAMIAGRGRVYVPYMYGVVTIHCNLVYRLPGAVAARTVPA